jgi:hypothetical protein
MHMHSHSHVHMHMHLHMHMGVYVWPGGALRTGIPIHTPPWPPIPYPSRLLALA